MTETSGARRDGAAERALLNRWVADLIDPLTDPDQAFEIASAWCERWTAGLERDAAATIDLNLASGKAVAPLTAARCILDSRRTQQFLRATDRALLKAMARWPDRPVLLMEAGCGPLAPLSLPFAARYPGRVRLLLLEANPGALHQAEKTAGRLGLREAVESVLLADAATLVLPPSQRPDVIVCEMIQRGLTVEPQVAATRALARQLAPGGVFLPSRIEVSACSFDAKARFGRAGAIAEDPMAGVSDLQPLFVLTPDAASDWTPVDVNLSPGAPPLHLLTRIAVDEACVIEPFDAAITLPEPMHVDAGLARAGGRVVFTYEHGPEPGPRMSSPG